MRTQREWKVQMVGGRLGFTRGRPWTAGDEFGDALAHFAGGFVGEGDGEDVAGGDAISMRWATRDVMTRVLPVPAPARIRTAPSVVSTAWRWGGLRDAREDIGRIADWGKSVKYESVSQ